ncbi:hypothetical protein KNE206_76550 [Kitasatospora sp. NE20-6]
MLTTAQTVSAVRLTTVISRSPAGAVDGCRADAPGVRFAPSAGAPADGLAAEEGRADGDPLAAADGDDPPEAAVEAGAGAPACGGTPVARAPAAGAGSAGEGDPTSWAIRTVEAVTSTATTGYHQRCRRDLTPCRRRPRVILVPSSCSSGCVRTYR